MKRAKLTRTIDPRVAEEAKRKASEQHTTVSAMVETFLRQVTTGSRSRPTEGERYAAATDPELPADLQMLSGCLKDYADLDPDEVRYGHLEETYGSDS